MDLNSQLNNFKEIKYIEFKLLYKLKLIYFLNISVEILLNFLNKAFQSPSFFFNFNNIRQYLMILKI